MTTESLIAIEHALALILEWDKSPKGNMLARLMPIGGFIYRQVSARMWLELWQDLWAGMPLPVSPWGQKK